MPGNSTDKRVYYGSSAAVESERIQTVRGVACLLLVTFHVVGNDPTKGLMLGNDSVVRLAMNVFIHIRMPLFSLLAGFVYAYRPVSQGQALAFAGKKLLRLLLPMVVVSTLLFISQLAIKSANATVRIEDLWRIYLFPYEHFWFLQAMMIVFAATIIVERLGVLQRVEGLLALLALAVAASLLVVFTPNLFSVNWALYLFPYFLCGLGANRFRSFAATLVVRRTLVVVFIACVAAHVYVLLGHVSSATDRRTLLALALGISGAMTLVNYFPHSPWLARVGGYSYAIYLYHVFFTAGSRIFLQGVGLTHDRGVLFAVGLVAGIAGPIFIARALLQARGGAGLLRRALLGAS